MSRALTSAQIIEKGDYLNPDFDPNSLTISQLLGVFGFHNINYPSPYTKGKLVQIFNDELKPKIKQLKKERLNRQNSQASDDGITDGFTGRPINEGRRAPTTRMVTRRASRAPAELAEPEPKPEPVKRRRSSAEPRLGGPSRRRAVKPVEPSVAEESEPEEPVRKVSRNKKKSEEAGAEARRVSQAFAEEGDSGWEDNNIFQSGAESSSPARPSPVKPRTRRSSAIRSRKSMSVPPQFAPPPSSSKEEPSKASSRRSSVKPPESTFEPVLPPEVTKPRSKRTTRNTAEPAVLASWPSIVQEEEETTIQTVVSAVDTGNPDASTSPEAAELPIEPAPILERTPSEDLPSVEDLDALSEVMSEGPEENEVVVISQRIAEGGQVARRHTERQSQPLRNLFFRFVFALLISRGFYALYNYRTESASIGFCDTGKKTNEVLETLRAHRALVEECNRENRTLLHPSVDGDSTQSVLSPTPQQTPSTGEEPSQPVLGEICPALSFIPIPQPDICAPCPAHATCTVSTMTCDSGYLLRPHPLFFFLSPPRNSSSPNTYTLPYYSTTFGDGVAEIAHHGLSLLLDGTPGFGPVAFPPRCVENPRRKRHIGALGKAIESVLASERGRRLCAGVGWGEEPGTEAEEAKKWGMDVEILKESMRRKTSPQLLPAFEDTFNEAIQQLVSWGGVFVGEDADGKRYLAHHTPSMDWTCTLKVKAREAWQEWRNQILGLVAVVASMFTLRRRRARNLIENDRVSELVQIALDLLRNQEIAHHTDPVSVPQPYLSSLQLRDLILQDEHSVKARNRLWQRVESIVESNSNVRTNLEEVEGGDEMRVWRWVGSSGPLSPGRPSASFPYTPQREVATST